MTELNEIVASDNTEMIAPNKSSMIIYTTEDGKVQLDVQVDKDTVWLSQEQLSQLFGKSKSTISYHISNIFAEGELDEEVVVRKIRITTQHGAIADKTQNSELTLYNLDVIISVGYRVHSIQGVRFRQWATSKLKEFIIKGYTLDVERLKGNGGGQYWYDLLNTIKDIRSSEKVLYRQVLDLYATSSDYDATAEETQKFFKIVQNKLHYATHGQTAAELIYTRADAEQPFMGLTTFHGSHPTKADVLVAKNYLNETELKKLNNMLSGYFDFAENRALEQIPVTMREYRELLDNILSASGKPILETAGTVSAEQAKEKALTEYRKYQVRALTPVEQAYLEMLEKETKLIKESN